MPHAGRCERRRCRAASACYSYLLRRLKANLYWSSSSAGHASKLNTFTLDTLNMSEFYRPRACSVEEVEQVADEEEEAPDSQMSRSRLQAVFSLSRPEFSKGAPPAPPPPLPLPSGAAVCRSPSCVETGHVQSHPAELPPPAPPEAAYTAPAAEHRRPAERHTPRLASCQPQAAPLPAAAPAVPAAPRRPARALHSLGGWGQHQATAPRQCHLQPGPLSLQGCRPPPRWPRHPPAQGTGAWAALVR